MGKLKAAPSSGSSNLLGGIDLNAIINSGGSVSAGGLGGSGDFSGISVSPQAATSSQQTTTSGATNKIGSASQATTGTSNTNTKKKLDKTLMDEQSMKVLQDTLAQMAAGGSPLLAAIDQARGGSVANTQNLIAGADPNAAVARAGGRTADLARQLQEQTISTLLGNSEAAGFGGDALAQLRAQDSAIRTGEAQARIEEEAYNTAISQQLAGTDVLNQTLAGGSAVQDQVAQLLEIAKGAVEQGTEEATSTTTTQEQSDTVTSEQGTANQTENVAGSNFDPLEWAKLAGQLSIAGNAVEQGPSATEKALALFPALGGNPGDLLASLTGTPGLFSNRGSAATTGARSSFNELLQMLGG